MNEKRRSMQHSKCKKMDWPASSKMCKKELSGDLEVTDCELPFIIESLKKLTLTMKFLDSLFFFFFAT
jgi:hypothetical protein